MALIHPPLLAGGSCSPEDFKQEGQVLSSFYQEGIHGGLGLRFRRKVPMFQVRMVPGARWSTPPPQCTDWAVQLKLLEQLSAQYDWLVLPVEA
jgi:hypothetical protein